MSERESETWPKAYRWHQDDDDVIVLHDASEKVFCGMGFEWWYSKVLTENADHSQSSGRPCWIEIDPPAHAVKLVNELATLRLQLAEKDRIIAEWRGIAEGMKAELKRERERSEARRVHVAALAAKLKAAGVSA